MKAAVLGLGESLNTLPPGGFDFKIGVNDIWGRIHTDYVITVDSVKRMKQYDVRYRNMVNARPKKFFAASDDWSFMPNFERVHISVAAKLENKFIGRSVCSPYCAAYQAAKMGATTIVLYGVDFNTHHYLSKSANKNAFLRALHDFGSLKLYFEQNGIDLFIGSNRSALREVLPKYKKQ